MISVKSFAAIVCLLFATSFVLPDAHAVAILASGKPNAPSSTTDVNFSSGQFSVTSDVAFDNSAGQWLKRLFLPSDGGGASSGDRHDIVETITNAGIQAWTDWHERVVSTTMINDPNGNDPGFLFDNSSLFVYRNNILLSSGSDYLLVPQPFLFGPPGNSGHWSAFDIFFQPGSEIQPGDTLRIEKRIFEVFGDANIWMPSEPAVIAQYPTIPEPATLLLAAISACVCGVRRTRAAKNRAR